MIARRIFLLILSGVSFFSSAQSTFFKIAPYFGQFYNDPFLNPENLLQDQKGYATMGHRRNSNDFGGVNTSFAAVQYKLGDREQERFNEVGLHFFSDNEGIYLQTTRAYLNYSRHVKLNDQYRIAGGLSFGMYNFTIKSDGTNQGESAATLDGGLIFKIYSEKTSYQIIVNQAYNTSVQPLIEKTVLIRNFNFFWNRSFKISDEFTSRNNIITRWSKETVFPQSGFNLAINSQLLIKELVFVGVTLQPKTGVYFSIGMDEIPISESKFGFEISYLVPTGGGNTTEFNNTQQSSNTTNLNQFEITLNYKF